MEHSSRQVHLGLTLNYESGSDDVERVRETRSRHSCYASAQEMADRLEKGRRPGVVVGQSGQHLIATELIGQIGCRLLKVLNLNNNYYVYMFDNNT